MVKLANDIRRNVFSEELEEIGEAQFEDKHAEDGWFQMENEVKTYNLLYACDFVVRLVGNGKMEFFRTLIFDKSNPIDDEFLAQWCETKVQRSKFQAKLRAPSDDIHSNKSLITL